jgi:syntenin-1
MTDGSNLYPSIETLLISDVVTGKKTVDELKETYLNESKTGQKTKSTGIYADLHQELDQLMLTMTNEDYSEIRDKENKIALSNKHIMVNNKKELELTTNNSLINNNIANMLCGNTVREVILMKDNSRTIGIGVVPIDNCHYVCYVESGSPASDAQIRFGDQIIRINSMETAGIESAKILKHLKSLPPGPVSFLIRNRPLQKVYQLFKNETNLIGIGVKYGCINSLVKDSSAARNGIPINHKIIEINFQNVIGMSDSDIINILNKAKGEIYLGLMRNRDYKQLMSGVAKKRLSFMDHSFMSL